MGKKANTQDNMNQKLALVIKSGKYRLGKYTLIALQPPLSNPF